MADRVLTHRMVQKYSSFKRIIMVTVMLGLASPLTAWGYVLQGPHLLELMVKTMTSSKTLRVEQKVRVEDPDISEQPVAFEEQLNYLFPDRFRSDTKHGDTHRIYVESLGQSITILDGHRVSQQADPLDLYKDLLMCRSRAYLHKKMILNGVDVEVTSLGRFKDRIVYVVGANYPDESVSQIWIDKESFLPLRWVVMSRSTPGDRLEFLYDGWQKKGNMWYPLFIETYLNSRLVRKIEAVNIIVNPELPIQLFDIPYLKTKYPPVQPPVNSGPAEADPTDEVQRTIEEFQKRFED